MEMLMNDCLEPIDRYLQIVLNLARNALYKYVSGVSGCLNAAREYKVDRFGEQESQRVAKESGGILTEKDYDGKRTEGYSFDTTV